MREIITTEDGSHTIFVPELNEHYHSVHGAIQESEHIFIRAGYDYCRDNPLYIFEVGFGTGLNALLTALKAKEDKRKVFYTSIEKYPLTSEVVNTLNYGEITGKGGREIFRMIHEVPWGTVNKITEEFSLVKTEADMTTFIDIPKCGLVYFDAFGPDKQPEMWSRDIFRRIGSSINIGGILVTYSAKGEVKRILRSVGFEVTMLPGPPGKREMIRANKI